jgi:hypothetical protein
MENVCVCVRVRESESVCEREREREERERRERERERQRQRVIDDCQFLLEYFISFETSLIERGIADSEMVKDGEGRAFEPEFGSGIYQSLL